MRVKDPSAETVGSLEQKLGFPPGTFRNPNGRDTRSDKKIETIRREWQRRLNALRKRRAKMASLKTLDLFSECDLSADAA